MHNVFTSMDSEKGDSASIIAFKTAVRESIVRRWSLDGVEPDSPLVLAAALDPCFKSLKFLTTISQRRAVTIEDVDCGNPNFQCVAASFMQI